MMSSTPVFLPIECLKTATIEAPFYISNRTEEFACSRLLAPRHCVEIWGPR